MMRNRSSHGTTPQLVIGLLIIAVGVLFLLDHLGFVNVGDYLRYWPVLLIIYGMSKFGGQGGRVTFSGGLFVLVGVLLLLQKLDVIAFSIWEYWPVLLVLIGLVLVRRAFGKRTGAGGSTSSGEGGDSQVNVFAMLGGIERKNSSQEFTGGEITAILGGCELDLRGASIKGDEAIIDVFTFWGGIDIRVPDDWAVSIESMPLMGGCEDKTNPGTKGPTKHLIIKGFVVMGGLEIGR